MQLIPHFLTAFALPGFLARSSLLPAESVKESLAGQRTAVATCSGLQSLLGSDVVHSAGKLYSHTATNAWNLFNTEQRPSCIVFPLNAQDVQEAMRAIFRDEVRYAVQAGGHTAMKGWNNVQNGVLISFSRMSNITYDPKKDTITLQPGIHWGDAVAQMEPFGVAPAGGRVTDVGTGLLLGGGLSYLAAEHGFSSDSLKEADVVLVNGDLVTASADPTNPHRDLFHALKGGANRFGIVTRYEMHAIHTGTKDDKRWFGGVIMYPNSSAEAVVKATANYVRTVNDPKTAILVGLIYTLFEGQISTAHFATIFYNGTSLPTHIFGDFLSIPSTASFLSSHSYSEVASILGPGDTRGFGEVFGASVLDSSSESKLSVEENEAQYMNAFARFTNFTTTFKDSLNATVLAFTPVLDCQIAASRARGGNVIDPPRGAYAALQFQIQYPFGQLTVPGEVEEGRQLMLKQIPPAPGLPLYIAESDAKQEVFKSYGQFELMKTTYEKYDPTRFNVRFTDGPIGL